MLNVRKHKLGIARNARIKTSLELTFSQKSAIFTGQTMTLVIIQAPNSIAGKIVKSHSKFPFQILFLL